MSERWGSLEYDKHVHGDFWQLSRATDPDYKPPKKLWWSMYGPNGETLVLPKRFTKKQAKHIAAAFNEAEKIGEQK